MSIGSKKKHHPDSIEYMIEKVGTPKTSGRLPSSVPTAPSNGRGNKLNRNRAVRMFLTGEDPQADDLERLFPMSDEGIDPNASDLPGAVEFLDYFGAT